MKSMMRAIVILLILVILANHYLISRVYKAAKDPYENYFDKTQANGVLVKSWFNGLMKGTIKPKQITDYLKSL